MDFISSSSGAILNLSGAHLSNFSGQHVVGVSHLVDPSSIVSAALEVNKNVCDSNSFKEICSALAHKLLLVFGSFHLH